MSVREQYNILLNKEYSYSLINEVNELKERCIYENNTEFIYKCNILIADIHIKYQNNTEALNLLSKDIKSIDKTIFRNIYLDYLDRLIYLYINKRNYHVAIRYIQDKESIFTDEDVDSLNRLYLEYSYAYGEMNDLEKSESYLLKILNNDPIDSLKSIVYSNLTKIQIDKNELTKAKEYLNQALLYIVDQESSIYCDYLLAKICVLDGQPKEALQLYENIFVNEEINTMTLAMMNDYLKLLNSLKKYDKALLLMNKLSLFINACNDLEIIKNFFQNKLDYFIATKDNSNISVTMNEIKEIEKQISENEKEIINTNLEDDKQNLQEKTKEEAFNKIDLLTSLVDTALKGNTLREIIMDFSMKVQKIIDFEELQFVLFNKIDEKEYQMSNFINCLRFKNNRLYEKEIEYEKLKGTIVERMINNDKPVIMDLSSITFDIRNLFNDKLYSEEGIKYLNSVPCLYKDDTFAAVIFSSSVVDLTDHANTVLIKVASKLLETSLVVQFINENKSNLEQLTNFVINEYNVGLFQSNNNTIYLSKEVQRLLNIKNDTISIDKYIKNISKSDIDRFIEARSSNENYNIKYKYQLNDRLVEVHEIGEPVTDLNGKVLYYQGAIKSLEETSVGYALSEKDLLNRINELKDNTKNLEFRFSLIKIRGFIDEYDDVKKNFGVEPYYLNDGSFIVILENESNQRTLDKLIKPYFDRSSIVRYPRDIIKLDEILDLASLMLEENKLYFSNDVYRGFIKKNDIINKIKSVSETNMQLISLSYDCFDSEDLFEIKPQLYGIDEKENIYKYLPKDLLTAYENKFIETLLENLTDKKCFFNFSNNSIYKAITEYTDKNFENVSFVMYEFNKLTPVIIEKLKIQNKQIYIDYNLINKLDAYYFTTGVIKGIYIDFNTKVEFNKINRLLNMFDLSLICYNNTYDYNKVCVYNNYKKVINK